MPISVIHFQLTRGAGLSFGASPKSSKQERSKTTCQIWILKLSAYPGMYRIKNGIIIKHKNPPTDEKKNPLRKEGESYAYVTRKTQKHDPRGYIIDISNCRKQRLKKKNLNPSSLKRTSTNQKHQKANNPPTLKQRVRVRNN